MKTNVNFYSKCCVLSIVFSNSKNVIKNIVKRNEAKVKLSIKTRLLHFHVLKISIKESDWFPFFSIHLSPSWRIIFYQWTSFNFLGSVHSWAKQLSGVVILEFLSFFVSVLQVFYKYFTSVFAASGSFF